MEKPKTLLIRYHPTANMLPFLNRDDSILQVFPALGLAYLASYLRKHGYPVEIIDAHALRMNEDEFRIAVKESRADIVGITSTTIEWPGAVTAARLARSVLPSALIVVGGPQQAIFPEDSLSFPFIDMSVMGDGEETLLEIVQKMERGETLENINGTAFKKDGRVTVNSPRPLIEDLSILPHPAVDLLPMKRYSALTIEHPFHTMVSSRGCPYKCGFCSQIASGDRVRFRSAEDVVSEMERYVKDYRAKEIVMFDETFTCNEQRVLDICRLIRDKNLRFRWNIRTRVDHVSEEMLRELKSAGCYGLHMGVESGDPGMLEIMRKGITVEQVRKAFSMATGLGFIVRGYFILGYLDSTHETHRATLNLARELDLDWVSFSIAVPLPATHLFQECVRRGQIEADYWNRYTRLEVPQYPHPTVKSDLWTEEELTRIMEKAYRDFYLRPEFVIRKLMGVRSFNHVFDLVQGLKLLLFMKGA